MPTLELRRGSLRLIRPASPGADREMAAENVVQQNSARAADPMRERRTILRDVEAIRLEALVATIQQRDAAEECALFWKRAFVALAGAVSTLTVLTWIKGRAGR